MWMVSISLMAAIFALSRLLTESLRQILTPNLDMIETGDVERLS
jgi:hypothetical protein